MGAHGEDANQTTVSAGNVSSGNNELEESGAAYVFRRDGNTWRQDAYLKAPNADSDDGFGYSVALSGNTVLACAYKEASAQTTVTNGPTASSNNSASVAGAAYVFIY